MGMNSKNWCEFHRINFDCDEWCPQCQEKLIRGLTEKCLTLLAPALTEMLNISVIIQSATPSSLLTDTKMTKTPEKPVTPVASTETENTRTRNSVPTAESEGSEMYWAEPSRRPTEAPACPKFWVKGDRAWGCVLPPAHKGPHSAYPIPVVSIGSDSPAPEHIRTAHHLVKKTLKNGWSWGLLFRWGSLWVGGHYSYKEKRFCINLIPCLTFWFTKPGGAIPYVA